MVYFIQAGKDGPIKIGYTANDVKNRLLTLQPSSPYPLTILGVMEGDVELEKNIHKKFKRFRISR